MVIKEIFIILIANLGVYFTLTTILTRFVPIDTLLSPKLKTKLIYSFFFMAMAFLVMQIPLGTTAGNRLDLRAVSIYVAGIFGGPFAGITVGTTVGLYRFFLGGEGAAIGLINCVIQGTVSGIYSRHYLKNQATKFHPLLTLIPVSISVVLSLLVTLSLGTLESGLNDLWLYRISSFLFQPFGTLILTIIIQDALKLSDRTASLSKDIIMDKVTKIYNIKYLDKYLNKNLAAAERNGDKLSVIFLDIDFFKTINDTYGHQEGDKVLFQVAQTIKDSLRPNDIVGRYGGDEFLIILPGCDVEEARGVGERVRANLRNIGEAATLGDDFSVSMGIATYPRHGISSELLIKSADNALYSAKNDGRNKLVIAG